MALTITSDPASDELLSTDQLALLIGMLRDQQGGGNHAVSSRARHCRGFRSLLG